MSNKIFHILFFLLALSFSNWIWAQESLTKNWDGEKIKGVRQLPYPNYTGHPFLINKWLKGKIEFNSGEVSDSLNLKYSSFKDELIYFNEAISAQIAIEKTSLKGFDFIDEKGATHIFRMQYFDGYLNGFRYFEVLSEGKYNLLCYRKVDLNTVPAFKDERGILVNMEFIPEYRYYLYSPEMGYTSVKLNQMGLISKFDKTVQKPIKKLLRKNRISIIDEASLLQAWKVIEKGGYKVVF